MRIVVQNGLDVACRRGWVIILATATCLLASTANSQTGATATTKMWVESSLQRVFPTSSVVDRKDIRLLSARNAAVSFQVVVRNDMSKRGLRVKCEVDG